MSAVDITKLKEQCRLVAEQFGSPRSLVNAIRILFESYSDRTYQLTGSKRPSLKIPEYHLPPMVFLQVELTLSRFCEENPLTTLEVVDALWREPMMEPRQIAASLLGKIPSDQFSAVASRLVSWTSSIEEYRLTEYLAAKGSVRIRKEAPDQWLNILDEWLQSAEPLKQNLALQSLIPLINDQDFENIPEVFDLLLPHLRKIESRNIPAIQSVLESLIHRTPNETVFFLKQAAGQSTDPNLFRLLRRCLPLFSDDLRISLREAIKNFQPE